MTQPKPSRLENTESSDDLHVPEDSQSFAESGPPIGLASSEVFERYYRSVFYLFCNRGMSPPDADDLAQETFLRVYASHAQLREAANLEKWIRSIALNLYRERFRRGSAKKRDHKEISLQTGSREDTVGLEEVIPVNHRTSADPLEDLIDGENKRVLRKAIAALPPQMKQCAILRYRHGLKYKEIAGILSITIPAVSSQLTVAKSRLEQALETFHQRPRKALNG